MSPNRGRTCKKRLRAHLPQRRGRSRWLLPFILCLLLVACSLPETPAGQTVPPPSASPVMPTASPAPSAQATRPPAASPSLTIWGPDMMAPLKETPGGEVLAAQIASFIGAHPGWQVQYLRKKPYGTGGLVHFLRSTQAVAPDSLPDLILLDMREIGLLAEDGLLVPLEPFLGADLLADLAPFAQEAGQVGEHLLALQYEADIRFLAYNATLLPYPPSTWGEILALRPSYLLPIGNSEGAVRDAFLPQYLALGGKLTDRDGRPFLDRTVVGAILEMYRAASQAGILANIGLGVNDASDCWPIYLSSGSAGAATSSAVAMTNVTSWDYGRERARLTATRIAPLPTISGNLISLSNGWGWALVAKNANQQAAAVAFLKWICKPEAMAAWARDTYHLPTRRSALALAIDDPEYLRFVQRLVEVTVPQPREPVYSLASGILASAIEAVARDRISAQAAAIDAAERMQAAQEQRQSGDRP